MVLIALVSITNTYVLLYTFHALPEHDAIMVKKPTAASYSHTVFTNGCTKKSNLAVATANQSLPVYRLEDRTCAQRHLFAEFALLVNLHPRFASGGRLSSLVSCFARRR